MIVPHKNPDHRTAQFLAVTGYGKGGFLPHPTGRRISRLARDKRIWGQRAPGGPVCAHPGQSWRYARPQGHHDDALPALLLGEAQAVYGFTVKGKRMFGPFPIGDSGLRILNELGNLVDNCVQLRL
jgi:hypothetical protein